MLQTEDNSHCTQAGVELSKAVSVNSEPAQFPRGELCSNCGEYATIRMSGCSQCLSCGSSYCG